MGDKPMIKDTGVRVQGGPIGSNVSVTINDSIIPVKEATIYIASDELITMNLTVRAEHIDVKALQSQTLINLDSMLQDDGCAE